VTNEQRSPAAPKDRHPAYARRWWIMAVLLIVECMDLLDSTVVNTAIPSIRGDLGSSLSAIQWIAGGYALTYSVGLVTGGRLGDIYGRRRIIEIGLVGFLASSLVCGLAPSTGVLIAARLVQGAFAAIMIPQGFGIIKDVFPDEEIGQAFGLFGPVIGLAAILGPIIGGGLVDLNVFGLEWRTVFLVNIPLGLIALVGCARILPESRSDGRIRLDVVGMTIISGAATLLIYPLIQGREHDWPTWMFVAMGASVLLFAAFGRYEQVRARRGDDPLVEPSIFHRRAFNVGLAVALFFFSGMAGVMLVFTLYLQLGEHFSALHAGLTLIPWMLGLTVGAALSGGWLGPKYGRPVVQVGGVVMIAGVIWLISSVGDAAGHLGTWDLVPAELLVGLGIGLLIAPVFSVVLAGVEDHEVGSASGVLNAVQQLGSAIGVAVLGTIFFSVVTNHGFVVAMQRTLWVEVGLVVVVLALSPFLPRHARPEEFGAPAKEAEAPSAEARAQVPA
jgi:EmrB/QacA subfamily drug resistance transporter